MPLDITVEPLEEEVDYSYSHTDFNVFVEGHRILTIQTYCAGTCCRWLFDVLKTRNTPSNGLVVGLSVDRQTRRYTRHGLVDSPYDILQLCTGSHCLIFHIPDSEYSVYSFRFDPAFLRSFFSDSRVTFVGMNMKSVANKLDKDLGIKMKNALDLNELAVKGLRRDDLDLGRYDLDRLAKAVLGKHWDVVRPTPNDPVEWFDPPAGRHCWYEAKLSDDKVKFATVDPYLCFLIGTKLLDMIHRPLASASSPVTKSNKKKIKNKNKNKNKS